MILIKTSAVKILSYLLVPVIFYALFNLSLAHASTPTCSITPFSSALLQGNTQNLLVQFTGVSGGVSVTPGELSQALNPIEVAYIVGDTAHLNLKAKELATPGFYDVSVSVKSNSGNAVCFFNIKIEQNWDLINKRANKGGPSFQSPVETNVLNTEEESVIEAKSATSSDPSVVNNKLSLKLSRNLSRGYRGEDVVKLQDFLRNLGFFPEEEESSGYFGSITEEAVKKYQKSKGIEAIGIVGPKTREALGKEGTPPDGENSEGLESAEVNFTRTLQLKMTGEDVSKLQEKLQSLEFFPLDVSPTGYFGTITEEAVKKYQTSKGIEAIGIVGPKTREALGKE